MSDKHIVQAENAEKIWSWLQTRGGLLVWQSDDLGDPSASVTTPAHDVSSKPTSSPGWKYPGPPERHITSADDVVVIQSVVLEEVSISLKRGCGFSVVLTEASARKMDKKTAKHQAAHPGKSVWWTPTGDLMFPSCVILMDGDSIPIADHIAQQSTSV